MNCDTGRHHSSLKKEVNSNVRYKVKTEECPEQIRAISLFFAVFKRRMVPVERERLITFFTQNGIRANHLLDAELRQQMQRIIPTKKLEKKKSPVNRVFTIKLHGKGR